MNEDIWNELNAGEIHLRDNLQFELKTEFSIHPNLKENIYKQEIFLFVPNPLQINPNTYSKKQFYRDETNLIRYKTPQMSLGELVDPHFLPSPLNHLQELLKDPNLQEMQSVLSDELKLFAVIFRIALQGRVYQITHGLDKDAASSISHLCKDVENVLIRFRELQESAKAHADKHQLICEFKYIDEFLSDNINDFLAILLKEKREKKGLSNHDDKQITHLIESEINYRKKNHLNPKTSKDQAVSQESLLYREGLLNRFVLESLTLNSTRISIEEKHVHILGALAAGIAMMIYMVLLTKGSTALLINSFPFVALAVALYILKDRIKEGFKTLYYKQAHRWFPDYATKIYGFKRYKVGTLKENFAFITSKELPPGFHKIRTHQFHEELQMLHRHETIIQYKRELILNTPKVLNHGRRYEMTIIFRFNIHRFLEKASNAFQKSLSLDSLTKEISEKLLPKVYHLNLIIRNTFLGKDQSPQVEIKTFSIVIDKTGIKRVEQKV